MQKPIVKVLHEHNLPEKLVFLSPTEPFNFYFKIGFMAGIFVASPSFFIRSGCLSRPALP